MCWPDAADANQWQPATTHTHRLPVLAAGHAPSTHVHLLGLLLLLSQHAVRQPPAALTLCAHPPVATAASALAMKLSRSLMSAGKAPGQSSSASSPYSLRGLWR